MESDIGNIRALREWTRRYFYTKQDINYFITKLNEGLKGYALMIIGPRNKKVTISPGNYQFTLNSDGWYRHLFFFNHNQEIVLSVEDGTTMNYQLDEYNDTICLSPYELAIPVMRSNYWVPSGYMTPTSDAGIFDIFDRNSSTEWSRRTTDGYHWFQYEFPEKKYIYKVNIELYTYKTNSGNPDTEYHFILQGSYDNTTWADLAVNKYFHPFSRQTITMYIDDPKDYIYYKWLFVKANGDGSVNQMQARLYRVDFYTVNQDTNNYQIATPKMVSNSQEGCVCSASSAYSPAWRAFDQDSEGSPWLTDSSFDAHPNPWVQFKFPNDKGKVIKKIQVWTRSYASTWARPTRFKFLGSFDGTNFTEIGEFSFRHNEDKYQQIFYVNDPNAYIYYRFVITNTTSNNSTRAGLKINMYEVV